MQMKVVAKIARGYFHVTEAGSGLLFGIRSRPLMESKRLIRPLSKLEENNGTLVHSLQYATV